MKDCLLCGCLKGFKHFTLYQRGREELIVTVGENLNARTFDFRDADDFDYIKDEGACVYLLGAYSRYKCPYVWVRSSVSENHPLIKHGTKITGKDTPLELSTTTKWKTEDIKLWDILAEIIILALKEEPSNPFEIDKDILKSLSPQDILLTTGALLYFLKLVYLSDKNPYATCVFQDIQWLADTHFSAIHL